MENKFLEHVDKEEKAVDKYGISCIVTRLFSFPVDNLSTGKVDKKEEYPQLLFYVDKLSTSFVDKVAGTNISILLLYHANRSHRECE